MESHPSLFEDAAVRGSFYRLAELMSLRNMLRRVRGGHAHARRKQGGLPQSSAQACMCARLLTAGRQPFCCSCIVPTNIHTHVSSAHLIDPHLRLSSPRPPPRLTQAFRPLVERYSYLDPDVDDDTIPNLTGTGLSR